MGMDQKRRNSTQRRLAVLRDLICDLDFNQSWSTSHTSLQVDELPSTRASNCNSVDDFSIPSRPLSRSEMSASFISNPLHLRFRPARVDRPKGIVEPDLDLSNIQCPVPDHLAVPQDAEAIPNHPELRQIQPQECPSPSFKVRLGQTGQGCFQLSQKLLVQCQELEKRFLMLLGLAMVDVWNPLHLSPLLLQWQVRHGVLAYRQKTFIIEW